jgi:hypothetical protein
MIHQSAQSGIWHFVVYVSKCDRHSLTSLIKISRRVGRREGGGENVDEKR